MKYTIDRETWYRGKGDESMLMRPDGMMCCLGQVGLQCGIDREQLLGEYYPDDKGLEDLPWPKWLMRRQPFSLSNYSRQCTFINDYTSITEAEREAKLMAQFTAHGDELEFIN